MPQAAGFPLLTTDISTARAQQQKKNKLMTSNKRLHHLYVYCTAQEPTERRDVCMKMSQSKRQHFFTVGSDKGFLILGLVLG